MSNSKIRKIPINKIDGFKFGNAENKDQATGCTVIICEEGAVGGVDVRGGAPATRETDLLKSENTVSEVHAVVLSGGSAFGLEAASGVMRELSDRDIGFDTGLSRVPIVCGASLFDLSVGSKDAFPDVEMGREAVQNAYNDYFENGNSGAGTGASVGKSLGMKRAMKSGLGVFACSDDVVSVGAVVAVNAVGDIYNGAGNVVAGLRSEDGTSIYGSIKALKNMVHDTEPMVINDVALSNENSSSKDHNIVKDHGSSKDKVEIAKAIKNAFKIKSADGAPAQIEDEYIGVETDIASSRGTEPEPEHEPEPELIKPEQFISEPEPEPEPEPLIEPETEEEPEEEPEELYDDEDEDEQGYGISFNTTLGCLVTNAKLTKSQANKLASILHDAYARAIKPVHGSMDGDIIFVLTTAVQKVNFDAFAALATDVMQYAIIDAASSAKSAYGLPASSDMNQ